MGLLKFINAKSSRPVQDPPRATAAPEPLARLSSATTVPNAPLDANSQERRLKQYVQSVTSNL
ncbi:MAG: hypothetical protein ABI650_11895 [Dokdonella sp.]